MVTADPQSVQRGDVITVRAMHTPTRHAPQSVGEAMAIGRTFKEALQKALRSLEIKRFGLCGDGADKDVDLETLRLKLAIPNAERIFYLAQAFQKGASIDEIYDLTKIDKWFLRNLEQIVVTQKQIEQSALASHSIRVMTEPWAVTLTADQIAPEIFGNGDELLRAKKLGFSDNQLGYANSLKPAGVRAARKQLSILPTYRLVDTCAAEFEAYTPYYYSTYGDENERRESGKRKVMILGGGPNRIGQGIEFDYCCVH